MWRDDPPTTLHRVVTLSLEGRIIACSTSGRSDGWKLSSVSCGGDDGCGIGDCFCVGFWMPCRGHFMCPFAVAGLGLRYLVISFSLMWGHPLRKPCRVARKSVEILGLHNDWCTNLTLLARVRTECKNDAPSNSSGRECGARPILGQGRGKLF